MADIVNALFNKANESLLVAKLLYDQGYYGDSISKSYYAMFYSARALLAKVDIFPKKHSGTINQFSLEFVKNRSFSAHIFKLLIKSEDYRKKADYDVLNSFKEKTAKYRLDDAKVFIDECRKFI